MCVDDGFGETVFVSCDTLMITNETAAQIADEFPGVEIITGATHTHSGPAAVEIFGGGADSSCLSQLKKGVMDAIRGARRNLRPATLRCHKGEVENMAFNRRFIMTDGTVETHPLKNDPHIIRPEGPGSKDLHVITAESPDGKILGGMVIFGCHATVMERSNALISSDFPGKTVAALEKELGAPFLYFQGACGNICQVNPQGGSRRELGKEWAEKTGREIAGGVPEMRSGIGKKCGDALRLFTENVV